MKKQNAHQYIAAVTILLFAVYMAPSALAADTATSTKGEALLQDMISAESARGAELNAKLDPTLGITHSLKRRETGNDVKLLQQFLKAYGAYPKGSVTGYFGPRTEAAVKQFQKKESIEAVGIVGPKTRARIVEISKQRVAQQAAIDASSTSAVPQLLDAVLAADIAENGTAATSSLVFSSSTPNIYAVLMLANVAQDTVLSYIRYYGGTYVDSGTAHPSRSGLTYFHFQWSLKPGSARLPGNYSLVFYMNGIQAKKVNYTIQ